MPRSVTATNPQDALETDIAAGTHAFVADEPRAAGGSDAGPSPFDLLLAALGACTSMTVRLYARRKNWPLESVTAHVTRNPAKRATGQADQPSSEKDRIICELTLEGPLSDEQRARLRQISERCPVHRALAAGTTIITTSIEAGTLAV